ncbi:MAG: glutamate--cysteine ligase, partial [Bdellovibrionales bacterium]|nr:glutamate--cysteine ligase [Bdellovibrionales bacterium]
MLQERIHPAICKARPRLEEWFRSYTKDLYLPFYSSFDIRDSGFKVVPVDANLYPAGFNNICLQDKDAAVDLVKNYLQKSYGNNLRRVALFTEEHTQNLYYWDNVFTLEHFLKEAGYEVRVVMPKGFEGSPLKIISASGHEVQVHALERKGENISV